MCHCQIMEIVFGSEQRAVDPQASLPSSDTARLSSPNCILPVSIFVFQRKRQTIIIALRKLKSKLES
jgi:hypothetical protein